MVYKFRIFSDETDLFEREISIDSEALFIDLHHAILDCVNYDKNMITSFFVCNEDWEKEVEITLIEMDSNPEYDSWVMDKTHLSELLDEEGQRMLFEYDNLTERCFYMELDKIIPNQHQESPKCTASRGKAPKQSVDFEEVEKKTVKKASALDVDDDFYGDSEFNEDELDTEGFGDLEGFSEEPSSLDDF